MDLAKLYRFNQTLLIEIGRRIDHVFRDLVQGGPSLINSITIQSVPIDQEQLTQINFTYSPPEKKTILIHKFTPVLFVKFDRTWEPLKRNETLDNASGELNCIYTNVSGNSLELGTMQIRIDILISLERE